MFTILMMRTEKMSDKKEAGKGDKPRPIIVDRETFNTNWEKTFGKKEELELGKS